MGKDQGGKDLESSENAENVTDVLWNAPGMPFVNRPQDT